MKIGSVDFSELAGVRRCERRGSGGCGASPNKENSTRMGVGAGVGVGVAEEHKRWGPVVRPAARAVFCMGRIRDEEEEGLGDVGSSSNRLKWSRDSWELHS